MNMTNDDAMNDPALGSITERTVAALSAGSDTVVWDRALTGFGVRVYPSGAKVYVVQARGPGGLQARHRGPARGDRGGRGTPARHPDRRPYPRGR